MARKGRAIVVHPDTGEIIEISKQDPLFMRSVREVSSTFKIAEKGEPSVQEGINVLYTTTVSSYRLPGSGGGKPPEPEIERHEAMILVPATQTEVPVGQTKMTSGSVKVPYSVYKEAEKKLLTGTEIVSASQTHQTDLGTQVIRLTPTSFVQTIHPADGKITSTRETAPPEGYDVVATAQKLKSSGFEVTPILTGGIVATKKIEGETYAFKTDIIDKKEDPLSLKAGRFVQTSLGLQPQTEKIKELESKGLYAQAEALKSHEFGTKQLIPKGVEGVIETGEMIVGVIGGIRMRSDIQNIITQEAGVGGIKTTQPTIFKSDYKLPVGLSSGIFKPSMKLQSVEDILTTKPGKGSISSAQAKFKIERDSQIDFHTIEEAELVYGGAAKFFGEMLIIGGLSKGASYIKSKMTPLDKKQFFKVKTTGGRKRAVLSGADEDIIEPESIMKEIGKYEPPKEVDVIRFQKIQRVAEEGIEESVTLIGQKKVPSSLFNFGKISRSMKESFDESLTFFKTKFHSLTDGLFSIEGATIKGKVSDTFKRMEIISPRAKSGGIAGFFKEGTTSREDIMKILGTRQGEAIIRRSGLLERIGDTVDEIPVGGVTRGVQDEFVFFLEPQKEAFKIVGERGIGKEMFKGSYPKLALGDESIKELFPDLVKGEGGKGTFLDINAIRKLTAMQKSAPVVISQTEMIPDVVKPSGIITMGATSSVIKPEKTKISMPSLSTGISLKTNISPMLKPEKSIVGSRYNIKTGSKTFFKQTPLLKQTPMQISSHMTDITFKQIQIPKQVPIKIFDQGLTTKQKIVLQTENILDQISESITDIVPDITTGGGNLFVPPFLPGLKSVVKRKRFKIRTKIKTPKKYTPTLLGEMSGIKIGRIPKGLITGERIRYPVRRKGKKKRRKKGSIFDIRLKL